MTPEDLDYVGFYDKPLTKFERLLETYLAFAPAGYRSFRQAMPLWLKQKLHLPREMKRGLPAGTRVATSSPITTSRMRPVPSSPRPSTKRPS